jgi:hypothetical protein
MIFSKNKIFIGVKCKCCKTELFCPCKSCRSKNPDNAVLWELDKDNFICPVCKISKSEEEFFKNKQMDRIFKYSKS